MVKVWPCKAIVVVQEYEAVWQEFKGKDLIVIDIGTGQGVRICDQCIIELFCNLAIDVLVD